MGKGQLLLGVMNGAGHLLDAAMCPTIDIQRKMTHASFPCVDDACDNLGGGGA
jgi:hypothetical protein